MGKRIVKDLAQSSKLAQRAANIRRKRERESGKANNDFAASKIQQDAAFKRWLREQDEIIATYSTQDFRGY